MSDDKYQLVLTAAHLQFICKASETCSRLVMGQMDDALDWLRDRQGNMVNSYDLTNAVQALTRPAQGLAPNQSGGVGWHQSGDALWDIYTQIRHRLAWDRAYSEGVISPGEPRKFSVMGSVCFDEPTAMTGPAMSITRLPGQECNDAACPFCGGMQTAISSNGVENFFVSCMGCGVEGPAGSTPESANNLWLRRSRPNTVRTFSDGQ